MMDGWMVEDKGVEWGACVICKHGPIHPQRNNKNQVICDQKKKGAS